MPVEHAKLASQVSIALDLWSLNSIQTSKPALKMRQLKAAEFLAKQPGQTFPKTAFRVFFTNPKKVESWEEFVRSIKDTGLPESYSGTLRGLKRFLNNGGGAGAQMGMQGLMFAVNVQPDRWMFDFVELVSRCPASEQRDQGTMSSFSLREQCDTDEVVARPGTLKTSLLQGRVALIGTSDPSGKDRWHAPIPIRI